MTYRERRIWDCTFAAAFVALGPDRDVRADEAMRMADLAVLKVRHLGGPLEEEEEVGCNVCDEDEDPCAECNHSPQRDLPGCPECPHGAKKKVDPILRFVDAAVRWCDTDRGSVEESAAFDKLAEAREGLPRDLSSVSINHRYLVDAITFDSEEDEASFATFTSRWGDGVDVEVPPGTKRIRVTVLHGEPAADGKDG